MIKKKKRTFPSASISLTDNSSEDYTPPQDPGVAPAALTALRAGANPEVLDKAKKYLDSQDFIGLCERYVEKVTKGVTGLYSSAIDAFNKQKDQVRTDFQNMPAGSQIFYAPDQSNQGYGHTAIALGNGRQIGAQNNGVKESDIAQWQKATGQQILGYLPPVMPTNNGTK